MIQKNVVPLQPLLRAKDRDLAQLVAHTSGGREVAGSSPVIPTKGKGVVNQLVTTPFFMPDSLFHFCAFLPYQYLLQHNTWVKEVDT